MFSKINREKRRQIQLKAKEFRTKESYIPSLGRAHLRLKNSPASYDDRNKSWPLFPQDLHNLHKNKKGEVEAILRVSFLLNNTFVNMSTLDGRTIFKVSAGSLKSLKKSTPFAAFSLGEKTAALAKEYAISRISFEAYGFGGGRKRFFKGLTSGNLPY